MVSPPERLLYWYHSLLFSWKCSLMNSIGPCLLRSNTVLVVERQTWFPCDVFWVIRANNVSSFVWDLYTNFIYARTNNVTNFSEGWQSCMVNNFCLPLKRKNDKQLVELVVLDLSAVSLQIYPVSVYHQAMGWTVRGSNPGGGEIFRTCPDRPLGPPSLVYNGYWIFPRGKERPGHDADSSPPFSTVVMKE
jgi:hypothetical protein